MKLTSLLLLLTLALLPISSSTVCAEEAVNEVFLLVKSDRLLAFSGLRNNWYEMDLRSGEKVIKSMYDGNVAVAYTPERALGFSGITGRWSEEKFRIHETVMSLTAEGNIGTVVTDTRALGFSAQSGSWVESRFKLSN